MRRIVATGCMVLGVFTTLFWFLILPYLKFTYLSRYNPNLVIMAIAMINVGGLVYLIQNRRHHPRWLIISGVAGNGLSVFVICYSTLGYLFLKYIFRM